jgi:alkylation response protein AidB-like acyl-CoA dehydrogenase
VIERQSREGIRETRGPVHSPGLSRALKIAPRPTAAGSKPSGLTVNGNVRPGYGNLSLEADALNQLATGAAVGSTLEDSMAKLFGSETAMFCAHAAIQIHGTVSESREFPIERCFGDAKIAEIYEGTTEIQRLAISRSGLGLQ